MLTLLIVDDDIDIVEGLSETVPWEQCNISKVLTANNGIAALDIIQNNKVDIMITDIKMPGMSGIALLEEAVKYNECIKAIILSGYAEFEYAQSAIRLGVLGYVLKPVKVEEVLKLANAAAEGILRQRKYNTILDSDEQYEYTAKAEFLKELLLKQDLETNQFGERLKQFEKELCGKKSIVILQLLELDLNTASDYRNICEKIKKCITGGIVYGLDYKTVVCLIQGEKNIKEWKKILLEEVMEIECSYGGTIRIGISSKTKELIKLPAKYRETLKIMELGFVHSEQRFFSAYEEIFLEPEMKEEEVINKIQKIKVYEEFDKIEEMIRLIENSRCYYVFQIKNIFRAILNGMQRYCVDKMIFSEVSEEYVEALKNIESAWILKQVCNSVYYFYQKIQNLESKEMKSVKQCLIQTAQNYIMEHYAEDINISTIAELTGRTSNYLSHLFSENSGITFSEFLNRMRIEKAKEKLLYTDDTLYSVSKEVGYNNERYFVKLFKKYVNMTPSQFRNMRK